MNALLRLFYTQIVNCNPYSGIARTVKCGLSQILLVFAVGDAESAKVRSILVPAAP